MMIVYLNEMRKPLSLAGALFCQVGNFKIRFLFDLDLIQMNI